MALSISPTVVGTGVSAANGKKNRNRRPHFSLAACHTRSRWSDESSLQPSRVSYTVPLLRLKNLPFLPIITEIVGLVLALDLVVLVEEAGQGPTVLVVHLEDGLLLRSAELGLQSSACRWRPCAGVSARRY